MLDSVEKDAVDNLEKGSDGSSSPTVSGDNMAPPSDKELRQLLRKLDMRIIPFVSLLYLCSYLDRVNIGMQIYCVHSRRRCRVAHLYIRIYMLIWGY